MRKLIFMLLMAGNNSYISGMPISSFEADIGHACTVDLDPGFTCQSAATRDEIRFSLSGLNTPENTNHKYPDSTHETQNISLETKIVFGLMTTSLENQGEEKSMHMGHTHNMPDWHLRSGDGYLKTYEMDRQHSHQQVTETIISLLTLPIFRDNLTAR